MWTKYNRRVVQEYITRIDSGERDRLLYRLAERNRSANLNAAYRSFQRTIVHKLKQACSKKAAETANAEPEAEAEAEDDEWSSDAEEVSWTDDDMCNFLEENCTFDGMVRYSEAEIERRKHPNSLSYGKPLLVLTPPSLIALWRIALAMSQSNALRTHFRGMCPKRLARTPLPVMLEAIGQQTPQPTPLEARCMRQDHAEPSAGTSMDIIDIIKNNGLRGADC